MQYEDGTYFSGRLGFAVCGMWYAGSFVGGGERIMKVRFSMQEKLYADVEFEIECESTEQVEDALDKIGECCSADDIALELGNIFGCENVKTEGLNSTDNIYPADECEFLDWIEDDEKSETPGAATPRESK